MFNSVVISIAITLVFIFLLLSVMVTAINDLIFTIWRSKSKRLEEFLSKLYFNDEMWNEIFAKVKHSPFINVLKKEPNKFPGAIPAETFTTALLAHIGKDELTLESIKRAVEEHKDSQSDFYRMLRALLSQNLTFDQLRNEIDKLFNNAMDRLTGWYKRSAKIRSFIVASAICLLLNVDSITITRNLWNNKDKADQMASSAVASINYFDKVDSSRVELRSGGSNLPQNVASNKSLPAVNVAKVVAADDSASKKAAEQLQGSYNMLSGMDLPIGWSKSNMPSKSESGGMMILLWLLKLLGIMLTTAAVSLGAPYWFDILNKLSPLKQGVAKPGKTPPAGAGNPSPDAPQPA
jgi:hypothetical protein